MCGCRILLTLSHMFQNVRKRRGRLMHHHTWNRAPGGREPAITPVTHCSLPWSLHMCPSCSSPWSTHTLTDVDHTFWPLPWTSAGITPISVHHSSLLALGRDGIVPPDIRRWAGRGRHCTALTLTLKQLQKGLAAGPLDVVLVPPTHNIMPHNVQCVAARKLHHELPGAGRSGRAAQHACMQPVPVRTA